MRTSVTRLAGMVILIGAIFGLILSAYGLFALWAAKGDITEGVLDIFELTNRTFNATDTMLVTVNQTLDQATTNLGLMRTILNDTASTIGQSTVTIDDTAALMGDSMTQFVENTQSALVGTQSTAQLIDDTLRALSSIPFVGPSLTGRYTPEVPLAQSIEEVNRSLDPLDESFGKVQDDLETASASMATIQAELESMTEQLADIEQSIKEAKAGVREYQTIMEDTRDRVKTLEQRVPVVVDTTYLALTIVLIWVGISQLGALLHAAELLSRVEH